MTVTMPRSRRARSLRVGRLSLRSKNAIARPASTTGCGTKRNTRRHVAEQRVDRQAGEQQQQRIVQARRPHRGGNLGRRDGGDQSREGTVMSEPAVLLCGHGSRDPEAVAEFEQAAAALRARARRTAISRPAISNSPARRSARRSPACGDAARAEILAMPGMLFAASHVKNDLPWEMNSFMAAHPGVEVRLGRDLGIDPKLLEAAADRIAAVAPAEERADSLLVVVGRGTNDPDANSNIAKVARMLWEGLGFGWAEAAFSGVAHPRVDAALDRAARLGFRRIVVFPYFLFTGVLVKRIYARDRCRRRPLPADRLRQGRAICATIRRSSRPFSTASTSATTGDAGDELPAVQIPHAASSATTMPSARRSRGITITCAAPGSAIATIDAPRARSRHSHEHRHPIIRAELEAGRCSTVRDRRLERFRHAEDRARQHLDLRRRPRRGETLLENPPTRHAAKELLRELLADAHARAASACWPGSIFRSAIPPVSPPGWGLPVRRPGAPCGTRSPRCSTDDERNRNNRFEVGAMFNRRVSGGRFPFWGCPASAAGRLSRPDASPRP